MKIALVIRSLILAKGGAERFSRNLIRGLVRRGHDIAVFCHDWDAGAEGLGIELARVPHGGKRRHPWREFSRSVWREIEKRRSFDVVFGLTQLCPQDVHRLGGGVYKYWYERKYGRGLPLQMLRPRVRGALEFERRMYSEGNYGQLITISEMDREILMERYDVPPDRLQTVYNGFDFDEFHPGDRGAARASLCATQGINPENTIVLFAANNYIRKGLPQAVEAILATRTPALYSLIVIGKGHRAVMNRLQRRAEGKLRTIWLDHVDNPAEFYRGADALLFPTLYDSFANVIGEALCCGLPVITTRQAGGAEMIIENASGFIARDADAVDELSSYIEKLSDRDTCLRFSQRAPELVSKLSIERCAEKTEEVLRKALNDENAGCHPAATRASPSTQLSSCHS